MSTQPIYQTPTVYSYSAELIAEMIGNMRPAELANKRLLKSQISSIIREADRHITPDDEETDHNKCVVCNGECRDYIRGECIHDDCADACPESDDEDIHLDPRLPMFGGPAIDDSALLAPGGVS